LELTLKDSIPANALVVYRINKVIIDQNYSLKEKARDGTKDTLMVRNTIFLDKESKMNIHPKVIYVRFIYAKMKYTQERIIILPSTA